MPSTILVVEDDAAIRRGVLDALKFAGHMTLEAGDGEKGLKLALGSTFDLMLLDLVLPHASGFDILKALRREPLLPVVARCQFGRALFDTELILRTERAGLVVAEIPVDAEELRPARTSIIRRIPRTISGLARLWFVLRRDS